MNLRELHRQALSKFKQANLEKENGNKGLYNILLSEAFALERQAAELLTDRKDVEPTRSVLFRSAANLAFLNKDFEEASRLAKLGLDGSPFVELRDELQAILQKTSPVQSMISTERVMPNFRNQMPIEEDYSYLSSLRKKAVQLKVEEESSKFGGAVVVANVIDFLRNLESSFKNFAEVNFVKALQSIKGEDILKESKNFSKNAKLLAVDLNFKSFGISVIADEGIMDNYSNHSVEFKNMRKRLFSEFKEDVLYAEYNENNFQERIKSKYTDDERVKIYSPVIKSISNKSYKVAVTNGDYTEKIKLFRPLDESAKEVFSPIIKQKPKEIPDIEYINVIVPMEVGKSGSKKISLENSLFNTANTYKLDNTKFEEQGFKYDFPIDINVNLLSKDGKSLLTSVYEDNNFEVKGDINNLKELLEKLIKKIAEYIANKDEASN